MSDLEQRLRVGGWVGEETAFEAADELAKRDAEIARLREGLEWISDELAFAAQSDCENGVRALNEKAAKDYLVGFPATSKAICDIQSKIDTLTKDSET